MVRTCPGRAVPRPMSKGAVEAAAKHVKPARRIRYGGEAWPDVAAQVIGGQMVAAPFGAAAPEPVLQAVIGCVGKDVEPVRPPRDGFRGGGQGAAQVVGAP